MTGHRLSRSAQPVVSSGQAEERYHFEAGRLQGYYRVYAWWPRSEQAGAGVKASVVHARGRSEHPLDQRQGAGQWQRLGLYGFSAGRPAQVQLSASPGSRFIADAVRFEYAGATQPPLVIRTQALSVGQQDSPYSAKLEAESGTPPYHWLVSAGSLPPGLNLDTQGHMSGTPTQTGRYPLSLRLVDAKGVAASQALNLHIVEAAAATAASPRLAKPADGNANATPPSLGALLSLVAAAPEGAWLKANLNFFTDVHTPEDLRPLYGGSFTNPLTIIRAWSSFAWDPNRGDLWIYGGGHANSSGNDVYRWRGSTRLWERASLPSEVKQDDLGNWMAIDGYDAGPPSAHTYDNNMFLPIIDRFIAFGGAAHANGGSWLRQSAPGSSSNRPYGPFLFNPNLADANKVGGSTGSHVKREAPHPEVLGGNMWQNRDIYANLAGNASLPGEIGHRDGCTAYAQENGKDVVYVAANPGLGTVVALYKYTISTVNNPASDTWILVAVPPLTASGLFGQQSCGYDAQRKLFVRRAGFGALFAYWDLSTPGANNYEVQFNAIDPTGEFNAALANNTLALHLCGLDFDPVRGKHVLWCGDGRVWWISAPTPLSATGWVIEKQPTAVGAVPNGTVGTGILGKWKYIANLDAYLGLQDEAQGNIWIYKPIGWQAPGGGNPPSNPPPNEPPSANQAPSIAIDEPSQGQAFANATSLAISANAIDADGSIQKVEFFAGQTKLGETATAPYIFEWDNAPLGSHELTAIAHDDSGARAVSEPVSVTVAASLGCAAQ